MNNNLGRPLNLEISLSKNIPKREKNYAKILVEIHNLIAKKNHKKRETMPNF